MGLLDRAGARLTADIDQADILVVNTCSFIDTAKQESVDTILEMARHKTSGSAKKLIVAGCLVERYRDEIRKSIPEVDAVVGTGELESILEAAGLTMPVTAASTSPFTILSAAQAAEIRPGLESRAATHKQSKSQNAAGSVSGHDFSHAEHPQKLDGVLTPAASSRPEGDLREQQGRFRRDDWQGATHLLPTYLYDESTPRFLTTPRSSAYIKIAEGCDHPCTFCVIPNLRGKFRSRRFESVVAEAQSLVARGVQELTLIGQDTTCYGEDLGLKDGLATLLDELARIPNLRGKFRSRRFESVVAEAQNLVARGVQEITLIGQDTTCYGEDLGLKDGLATLLDALARIPNLRWLRFLYAYPNRITNKLLETIAKHDNICKYLDVPLQHASPTVLKTMKRGAGADIFLKTLDKVRKAVPGIALRTSFIVGFPGETVQDIEILEQFITEAKFDWLGVFSYSDEEGSGAFSFNEKVPKRTIEARKRRLMKLQQKISKQAKQQWIGRELVVLAEGESDETPLLWEGRTQFHAPEIDGKVYINDFGSLESLEPGRFYRARITEAHEYDVVASIVSDPL